MGIVNKLLNSAKGNRQEFKRKLKEAQEDDRIARTVEERNKSSNRRALERELRDRDEAQIKEALDKINKQRSKEMWKTKNTILGEKTTMLNNERPILKEKNIFMNKENMFSKKHALKNKTSMGFFK